MSLILKADTYSNEITVEVWQNKVMFVCEQDYDYDPSSCVSVDIDKQKTIELIEFLQKCVKEME